MWDCVPLTFVVDITQKHAMEQSFDKFALYFNILEKNRTMSSASVNQLFEKVTRNGKKPYEIKETMWGEENMWILKPNDNNCGRGVRLFSTLDQVKKLITEYSQIKRPFRDTTIAPEEYQTIKSETLVLQKYIERPMLIQSRKFDIRCWVLITQDLDCYLFEQGYVRLSSYQYSLKATDLAIHLTNHAIQV